LTGEGLRGERQKALFKIKLTRDAESGGDKIGRPLFGLQGKKHHLKKGTS